MGGPLASQRTHRPHTWAVPSSASSPSPSRGGGGGVRAGVYCLRAWRLCPPRTVQPRVADDVILIADRHLLELPLEGLSCSG